MKRILTTGVLATAVLLAGPAMATELETEQQKLGYIIGLDIGKSLQQQGADLDLDAMFDAIRATMDGTELAMTPEEAAAIREAYISKRRSAAEAERANLASANAAEGDAFLLENSQKEGITVTESGLQYEVISTGEGQKPAATDSVTVHYRGTLLNGNEFDSSYSRGEPATFQLNQVIPGWTEGLQLMPAGSQFKFYIPANLAYGPNGPPQIGPNATLVFEVELISVN